MGAPELLALSLGLSVAVAALGLAGGTIIERLSADPGLRDRVWGAALLLPVLPPVATALLLMTPAPVHEVAIAPTGPAITVAAPTTMQAAPTPPSGLELDGGLIAVVVIAVAVLLALLRIAALMLRARRLSLLIRAGETPDAATMETVRDAARGLAIPPPPVVVSAATPEALLAGLRPARLVLPLTFIAGGAGVTRAVIAHELAHLKRGDHRALWVEELVLALLAANPLMPLLRVRRAAAREEACDAIALADAPAETRRAYAQTLIEALRNRAGPQAPGPMPALTFTGAGRTTAMHRLKAVLTPAAPANRRARIGAVVGTGALLSVIAAGTVAVAAQREPVMRVADAEDRASTRVMINGEPVALDFNTLPPFALQADSIVSSAPGLRPAWMDFRVKLDPAAPPLSIEGVKLPSGVTTDIVAAADVARIERSGPALNIVLKRNASQQPPRAPRPLTPDQQARYRNLSAQGYREVCASNDPLDDGFCAGVMFAQMDKAGVCPSAEARAPGAHRGAALAAYTESGRRVMRRLAPRTDEGAHGYAERAMAQAFPCRTAQAGTRDVVVWMPVGFEGRAALAQGDLIHVSLTDGAGTMLAETSATGGEGGGLSNVRIPLTEAEFPRMGQGNRAYTLTGEIRRADGSVERADAPVTVRLSPGSQRTARTLRPSLTFSAAPPVGAQTSSLRFDVGAALPTQVRDGDVLNVWIDGPFERGVRTTRTLSVPLAQGAFRPISTQVDVAAPLGSSDFVYRAEIVDRDGRKTHETRAPALLTVRGPSAVAKPSLLPIR